MPKYKIGDRVLLKPITDLCTCQNTTKEMRNLGGTVVTIVHDNLSGDRYPYKIKEDNGSWVWGDKMFVGLIDEIKKTNIDILFKMEIKDLYKVLNCSCCINYETDNCPSKFNEQICKDGTLTWLNKEINNV